MKKGFRDFLDYLKEKLWKPAAWESLWPQEQREWRSQRRWFVLQLLALVMSIAALIMTLLRR